MTNSFSRRTLLAGIGAAGAVGLVWTDGFAPIHARDGEKLKPGEFWWKPELSPEGVVAIIVSIPDQLVHVYRSAVRIGLSTCSTGKKGHSTPTGVFTILQKDKHHHSSTYNNAPMPNMNRLTWSGVALHAGNLPGYPASHGCIRLPLKFSELLFGVTHVGTAVIVADDHSQPADITHPGGILSALAEDEIGVAIAGLGDKGLPPADRHDGMQHAVSILVSSADRELYILRDGEVIDKGRVDIDRPSEPLGSHVYILRGSHDGNKGLRWKSVGYAHGGGEADDPDAATIGRVQSDPAIARKVAELMHPGLVLVLTDQPAHPETRSGRDLVVMAQDVEWTTGTRVTR